MRWIIWVIGMLSLCYTSYSQAQYRMGLLPDVVVSTKLSNGFSLYGSTETRIGSGVLPWRDLGGSPLDVQLTDVSFIIARRLNLYRKVAGGYLLRVQDGAVIHRLIQQYTIVTPIRKNRLAHRFSADQTWRPDQEMELRMRYRIATDRALQGDEVDPRELYFKIEHEYLGSLQGGGLGLEIRTVPALGLLITDSNKIEAALDYRLSDFIDDGGRHTFWAKINWYLRI